MRTGSDRIESKLRVRRHSPTPVHGLLIASLAVVLTLAMSTSPLGRSAQTAESVGNAAATTEVVAIRAKANNKYVTAENAGKSSLIANRTAIGPWETFDLIRVNSTDVYLRAHANGKYVCAEAAGGAALISNRDAAGAWETFQLINNNDGTKSLKARANGKFVSAESAGGAPLIANRTAVGPWEKFDVVGSTSPDPAPTSAPTTTAPTTPTPISNDWPGPNNTGVPSGTPLTLYTGPSTITTANTTITGKRITSCLEIRARSVIIRSSLIQSNCFFNVLSEDADAGLQLVDVEIDGRNNTAGDSAVAGDGYTCIRCNIHGTVDGFKAGTNVEIRNSYIHDLAMGSDSHNDGIQSLGTTSLKIVHNRILVATGATSAVILSTGSASEMRNVLIQENLLGGGAFTVYGGYEAGRDVRSRVSNIQILNNRFSTVVFQKSGAYGPMTSIDPPVVVTGNVWHDGPKAGQPV